MKIVYVNEGVYGYATGDPSQGGGAERYAWHLTRALASAGWSVTVGVYALPKGAIRVVDDVKFLGLSRRAHFLLDWYMFLRTERPDWCLWQCSELLWGPMVGIAQWLGIRAMFSAMHDRDVQPRKALKDRKNWWPIYQWGLQRSNLIFVQHRGQRDLLPAAWHHKTFLLPGIVSLPDQVIPHSKRVGTVAWVAVIRPPKRPDLLVEIARQLPMIQFTVCGAPSLYVWDVREIERIMAQLKSLPNVDYRGHVAPDDTLKVISDASLLLSTSDGEGFPSVFLEAWAAGTPVVSMQIDPDNTIREYGLGEVPGSIEGTVNAVHSLMASPERRENIGMKARQHVEKAYSSASAVEAVETAIASVSTGHAAMMQPAR